MNADTADTFLSEDVRDFVIATYGAGARAQDWAIAGLSEGGTCALSLSLRHPDKFAFWCPRSGNWYPGVLADDEQLKKCVNVPVYIFYGSKDHELILDQAPHFRDLAQWRGMQVWPDSVK